MKRSWLEATRFELKTPICLLLLLAFLASGCGYNDDTSVTPTPTSITIQEERNWFNGNNLYEWNSPGPVARLSLEIDDFHHGDVWITVYDAMGRIIFSKYYWSFAGYYYIDGEFVDFNFTDPGAVGLWTIVLDYWEFTGELTLTLESTTEPDTDEPDIPDPTDNSSLLDLTFGSDGRAVYSTDKAAGTEVVTDSSGKVLMAGAVMDPSGIRHLAVWRFLADGDLDSTFGINGVFMYGGADGSGATDIVVDGSDRALVSGWVSDSEERTDHVLVRLTSAGSLDMSFGAGGVAIRGDVDKDEVWTALAIDGSGRILATGRAIDPHDKTGNMRLARYSAFGILDTTFGTEGIVTSSDNSDRGFDLVVDTSSQPIVIGLRGNGLIMWRYTTTGATDATFGTAGVVTSAGAADEYRIGRALALSADGSITVAGLRIFDNGTDPVEMALWRYASNGTALAAFNGSGFLAYQYPGGWAAATSVQIDTSNRILVAGVTKTANATDNDASATLWRYSTTGAIDTTLNGSSGAGVVRFDERSGDAATVASGVVVISGSDAYVSGTAFDHSTASRDALVWKVSP